jgi:hypothetical protein
LESQRGHKNGRTFSSCQSIGFVFFFINNKS